MSKKEDSLHEHTFVEKVAESIKNIEITPQHSAYLTALTSGLLANPEYFAESLIETSKPTKKLCNSSGVKSSNCKDKLPKEHEKELLKSSGMGHGRLDLFKQQSEPSSGRGKLKLFVDRAREEKKNLDEKFKSPKECILLENNTKLVPHGNIYLKDIDAFDYPDSAEKKSHSCLEETKLNSACNSELRENFLLNKPNVSDSSFFEAPDSMTFCKNVIKKTKADKDQFKNTRRNYKLKVLNKDPHDHISPSIFLIKHHGNDSVSGDNKSAQIDSVNKWYSSNVDMPSESTGKEEEKCSVNVKNEDSKYLYESSEFINPFVNNSDSKHGLGDSNDIKIVNSIGRGLFFRKFSQLSDDNNIYKAKSGCEVSQQDNASEELFNSNNNLKTEHNKDEVDPDLLNSDYKDRYFDIEEPVYLNCHEEYPLVQKQLEIKKNENNEHYEKILSLINNNEHEPLDRNALVNPIESLKPEAEQLEQQILRDYSVGQITERMKMSCGLIHGNVIANPVSKLSELKLQHHILSNLNAKNMRELSRSQMFAVPILLQRKKLVLIGPPNSGKTLAYVMAVLSLLHDDAYYKTLKPGNGPRCVFISSCAQNVNYISQFCSAICGAKMTIITTHGGGLEMERKEELTNGCEILVTTPRCWLRLLKHTSVTNLSRVCHIIFDDSDVLMNIFLSEILEIMTNVKKMLHIRKRYCNVGIQVVIVGERWTPVLEEMIFKGLDSPVLCITTHLEAALYARIKPKTYILSPDSKLNKLKELLELSSHKIRVVIVCQSAEEVKQLRPRLEPTVSVVLVAHEEMGLNRVVDVSDQWIRCASPPILLCSDMILSELAVTNAQWLIHYSMPDNKTSFSERFSTIKEHLYDRIKYPKTAPPECQVHILVDDTNELQFPELINFMERLNTPIPELFLQAVKKISILKEEKKADALFCENMLMFGTCWKKDKCKKQHIFNKLRDHAGNLPLSGIMKVKLLNTHNPSHYSVRILGMKKSAVAQWTDFPSNYALIAFKMSNHYSSRENRFAHGRVKLGDIVAIELEPDLMFKRAKVIDIVSRDEKFNPEEVIVYFIDEGTIDKYLVGQLLYLPRELQVHPQEAYDLYLTGLRPVDCDNSWSFASTLRIQKSISNLNFSEADNTFFIATIKLVAGTSLLATSFLCYEWLELNKCHVVLFSPKKFILDTGLAESNPAHFTTLMNLALQACLISSIPEDTEKKIDNEEEEEEEIQWAYLHKEYFNVVHVITSISPSLFYLKIFKFSKLLDGLEKELTALLSSKIKNISVIYRDLVCAAKNPRANRWNRAVINDIVSSNEVEVFFVDYGDRLVIPLSEISHLPQCFIRRLPFQAIECSLVGISPLDDDWLPQSVEIFDSLCFNDKNKLKTMFAKVCEVENANSTSGHHFKVILAHSSDIKANYINKELVFKGYANWDPETKHHLTDSIILLEEPEGSDGCDDDWEEHIDGDQTFEKGIVNKEFTGSNLEGASSKDNDILSVLNSADFDLESSDKLIDLLPPALQDQLKTRHIDKALNELSDFRAVENSKDETESKTLNDKSNKFLNSAKEECVEAGVIDNGPLESCGLFHPTINWYQRDNHIRIKISLPSVIHYEVNYSNKTLMFQAILNEKYYWFNIILFGKIRKESVKYSCKGLYFEIKMEKFIKGELWPRLIHEDFKLPWIKLDPDFVEQEDVNLIELMFNKGLRKGKFSYMRKKSDFHSMARAEVDSDLDSISSNSCSEELYDLSHDESDSESD